MLSAWEHRLLEPERRQQKCSSPWNSTGSASTAPLGAEKMITLVGAVRINVAANTNVGIGGRRSKKPYACWEAVAEKHDFS